MQFAKHTRISPDPPRSPTPNQVLEVRRKQEKLFSFCRW